MLHRFIKETHLALLFKSAQYKAVRTKTTRAYIVSVWKARPWKQNQHQQRFASFVKQDSEGFVFDVDKMQTTLYKIDGSPPARAVMMVMDILGLEFQKEDLNPVLREQDEPEFVKKNPMRTIPILDEEDYCLSDSHAIILYLLDKYGKPEHAKLYPTDKRKRATINSRLFFDCGILFPRLRAVMAPTYGGRLTELSKYMIVNIEDAYKMLENYLSATLYMADDVITVADISLITTVSGMDGLHPVDEKTYPKLKQWLRKMHEQSYWKRISATGHELYVMTLKKVMELNKENQKSKL